MAAATDGDMTPAGGIRGQFNLVDATGEVWLADPGRRMLTTFLAGVDASGWRREQVAADPDTVTIHRLRLAAAHS